MRCLLNLTGQRCESDGVVSGLTVLPVPRKDGRGGRGSDDDRSENVEREHDLDRLGEGKWTGVGDGERTGGCRERVL